MATEVPLSGVAEAGGGTAGSDFLGSDLEGALSAMDISRSTAAGTRTIPRSVDPATERRVSEETTYSSACFFHQMNRPTIESADTCFASVMAARTTLLKMPINCHTFSERTALFCATTARGNNIPNTIANRGFNAVFGIQVSAGIFSPAYSTMGRHRKKALHRSVRFLWKGYVV